MKPVRNTVAVGSSLMLLAASMIGQLESSGRVILTSYRDIAGVWTICDGITKGVTPGMTVTPEWCARARAGEIEAHSQPLATVPYQLPGHVILAMTDLCYNVGTGACASSTAIRQLKANNHEQACDAILLFKFSMVRNQRADCSKSSSGCYGIWTRRQIERSLCRNELTPAQAKLLFKDLPLGGLE